MTIQVCALTHRRDPDRPRRTVDGLAVCRGHQHRSVDALADLPRFYDELLLRHLGGPATGAPKVSGSSEDRMPYRPDVGDERDLIRAQLASWAGWVFDARTHSHDLVAADPHATAGYLTTHLEFVLASGSAKDFCDEILTRHAKAFTILYPTGQRKFAVGGCTNPDCDGTVYAVLRDTDELLPSALKCNTCDLDLPASAWLRYGRAVRVQLEKAGMP